jgi:hypothetical protein
MRLSAAATTILAATLLLSDKVTTSFVVQRSVAQPRPIPSSVRSTRFSTSIASTSDAASKDSPCDVADGNEGLVNQATAASIRSASVLNVEGDRFQLGDAMSKTGTSIVVFLRHMG